MLPFLSSRFFIPVKFFIIFLAIVHFGVFCMEDETVVKSPMSREHRLFLAVEKGNLELVKELLAEGISINAKDSLGNSPLIKAADEEDLDMAKFLIEKGANVNLRNTTGETALYRAVYRGNLDLVKLLVKAGAETKVKTVGGVSLSELADERGEEGILQYLSSLKK
ncbi:ankyrin repeat domain-containing protein [Leptospira sp. 2 VSF19]|uniref:Ankyrin repeat domain-containing protein n=1 Tax=Leptospira soteropolitanensis TaxID=2950025 RepID=A0AAW5VBJ9_9LEPT|nr:ankyrin repeat domain-containing protein [Leptospira soteropolitanensis]MCW7491441.1 ankyrin repeat domain-containing protein [Leptospira soteropolitanensis]MCW7499025.1 ankyrin repeat domain-containing protein [Leptospira soteropolitanensis]MCW7521383.1 ankyrin repeat domain-containing protein [Leptospira soteropolitanensis]MCW7525129.1 ankyrin repeat domain-containing protein [Leptospira soteropolitanensis]MCW7528996.1 ankyrin repeat domain-containing protein [Leptospira soteropolitanensi